METTRVFTNGRSQAVRIPKAYRFSEDEVYINRIGDVVVLTAKSALARSFDLGASLLTEDFLADGMPESKRSFREEL